MQTLRDRDRQTALRQEDSTHAMGRLERRNEEEEVENPNLGLVNLLEGKVL